MSNSRLYKILGVSANSTPDELKRAYREKARLFHPDVAGESGQGMFQLINEAYDILLPEALQREAQGQLRSEEDETNGGFFFDSKAQQKINIGSRIKIRQSIDRLNQLSKAALEKRAAAAQWLSGGDDAEEQSPNFQPRQEKVQPLERKSRWKTSSPGYKKPTQDGSADQDYDFSQDTKRTYQFTISVEECIAGTTREVALNIDGETKKAVAHIPRGVKSGQQYSLALLPTDPGQIVPESVEAVVIVKGDEFSETDGLNLIIHLPLTIGEATLGVELTVATAKGSVNVKVPPLNINRKPLRVRGHGIEDEESEERGDLVIKPFIVAPDKLSAGLEAGLKACDAHYSFDLRSKLPKSFGPK